MDKGIGHKANGDRRHKNANVAEVLYHIRLHDFKAAEDTWEPVQRFPPIKALSYYILKNLPISDEIGQSASG